MEDLKLELEPKLSVWLETFYEIEALNSLANFAMLHPKYVFPILDEQAEKEFNSVDLGHPLISETQRVCNNFGIVKGENLLLITGSNMAGKSTFLRTVGINLILSYAGAPVCAGSLTTKLYRVFTSINVTDSLEDGYSHFYAEVKRLRYLLDELTEENKFPLFFFVDEIYKGTNNRERYIGSAAFLKSVAKENGIGLVSSHDLELADLDNEIHQLRNLHFVESIKDSKMHFEYTLNEGPCPSTNAVQIMKLEGLPT
jgi:DNA mismatch repair ATPase MutS